VLSQERNARSKADLTLNCRYSVIHGWIGQTTPPPSAGAGPQITSSTKGADAEDGDAAVLPLAMKRVRKDA